MKRELFFPVDVAVTIASKKLKFKMEIEKK